MAPLMIYIHGVLNIHIVGLAQGNSFKCSIQVSDTNDGELVVNDDG